MLATELADGTEKSGALRSEIETWATNERMRHIPSVSWIADKVDVDLRHRIETLCAPLEMLFADDPARAAAEQELRGVCTALERLADVARHSRGLHPPTEVARHVIWSLNHAVTSLRSVDGSLVGRRFPCQTGERSKAEPLYAALLVLICALDRLVTAVRAVDADIDGRLNEYLVRLEHPLPEEPMA